MFDTLNALFSQGWLSTAFAAVSVCSTFIIIIIILSENRSPVKSLAWVTVLLLLPVVGVILYIFFGRNIKNKRMISRRNRRKLRKQEKHIPLDVRHTMLSRESIQQINLGKSLTGAQFYPDNNVTPFIDGSEKFKALEADLKAARHSINMQYYIFEDDELGNRIADILVERAWAGVKVRLIYDHVGSIHVSNKFFRRLNESGIEAYPFFKVSFRKLGSRINWRNHRKICVIDQRIGYIGGMNVADRYISGGKNFNRWRDTHVRVEGPIVAAMQYSFAVDWNFMGRELIENELYDTATFTSTPPPKSTSGVGIQLLTSGPTSQWANIALALQKAIANAGRRVYIQSPYFLPTEGLLKALQAAALAHVDVRIMIPMQSDSRMLTFASASYIAECLRAGIKIYLYKPGMLHSKMIIIDDEFVTIGSTNFDFRSFEYNFEANLFFFNKDFNTKMTEIFRADLADSERVQPAQWRKRPFFTRVAESVIRLLSPIL